MDTAQRRIVYVDNNATTRVDPLVFETMKPFLEDLYGNPSSIHSFGGQLAARIEEAREKVASLLGAQPSEIIFTSCGTESNNAAINSALFLCPKKKKIVVSSVEHPAVLNVGKELERRGYYVSTVPVDSRGRLDMERLEEMVDDETAVVSIMWANNETGNIHDVHRAAETAHKHGAVFHTDAVQAVGKVPINMADSNIDMLSFSGHKLHAPKGIGVLYVRRGVRFRPLLVGGHQERGRRGGTENIPYIAGLGRACELAARNMQFENTEVKKLRDRLEEGIKNSVPKVRVNGDTEHRLPNTSNISFEFIEGEAILMLFDQLGICASSGSACTTGSLEPSHVLKAMGVPYTAAHGAVRFSFSRFNTGDDVDYILEHVPSIIKRLRDISPYWEG